MVDLGLEQLLDATAADDVSPFAFKLTRLLVLLAEVVGLLANDACLELVDVDLWLRLVARARHMRPEMFGPLFSSGPIMAEPAVLLVPAPAVVSPEPTRLLLPGGGRGLDDWDHVMTEDARVAVVAPSGVLEVLTDLLGLCWRELSNLDVMGVPTCLTTMTGSVLLELEARLLLLHHGVLQDLWVVRVRAVVSFEAVSVPLKGKTGFVFLEVHYKTYNVWFLICSDSLK